MLSTYIATCPEEIKGIVVAQLQSLGAQEVVPGFKAVEFKADLATSYHIHLKLSTASRILRVIKDMAASSPKILEATARRIRWDQIFSPKRTYLIEGVAADRGEDAMSSNDISKAVRLGLEDFYQHRGETPPKVDLKEPKVTIVAFVHKRRCMLSVETSGKTLHKRGYRLEGHPAPLKETLAASLLHLAGYDGSVPFLDPMCGSGTIAIEAAYIALGKAPLIHRKKGDFGFEWLADFDKDLWRNVQDEVRAERHAEAPAPIFASDIEGKYVEYARGNALRARVERDISFSVQSFLGMTAPAPTGLILCNLPYGERLTGREVEDLQGFYQEVGNTLKRNFSGWRAALLAAEAAPIKFIGLRPSRRIPVLNGSIPCRLLIFDLYAGTKRVHKLAKEGETDPDTADQ